jgi:DNA-binding transcriptional MerR regulator
MKQIRRFFSSKEVLRLTGATYRQLDTWIRGDIVRATGVAAAGKGSRRLFTFLDVLEVRVVVSFTQNGVKLAMLKQTVSSLREHVGKTSDSDSWSSTRLITDGRRIFRFVSSEEVLESLDGCKQLAFAFDIGDELGTLINAAKLLDISQRYERKLVVEKTYAVG